MGEIWGSKLALGQGLMLGGLLARRVAAPYCADGSLGGICFYP